MDNGFLAPAYALWELVEGQLVRERNADRSVITPAYSACELQLVPLVHKSGCTGDGVQQRLRHEDGIDERHTRTGAVVERRRRFEPACSQCEVVSFIKREQLVTIVVLLASAVRPEDAAFPVDLAGEAAGGFLGQIDAEMHIGIQADNGNCPAGEL